MKTINPLTSLVRWSAVLVVVATVTAAKAVPYASCITNNAGTISYILNENADNVKVAFDDGTVTNNLGALLKGVRSFSLGAYTNYAILVYNSNSPAWTKTSVDTNPLLLFNSGRGISVNNNPKDTRTFGRTYIVNTLNGFATNVTQPSMSRTLVGKGLYVLNSDLSDAFGQGVTAITNGLPLNAANTSPWKLGFGKDDGVLYVNSFSSAVSGTWAMDADLTNSTLVISPAGDNANHYDPANTPIVTGSLANGNMVLYNVEGSKPSNLNKVARWDVNSGPIPAAITPAMLGWTDHNTANLGVAGLNTDIELGPDGKIYTCINRSGGTDTACVQVFDTDGVTILWDSRTAAGQPDVYRLLRAIMISPDGTKLAGVRDGGTVVVVTLTNGIPDLSSMSTFPNNDFTTMATGASARDIAYDAAGNIYVIGGTNGLVSSATAPLVLYGVRVYSPGGVTTTRTFNDLSGTNGTFSVNQGLPTVNITPAQPIASEDGTTGTFTISRTGGDITAPLAVHFQISGTASNGIDYATITSPATILANQSSVDVTVTPIQDLISEATEGVTLTISNAGTYFIGAQNGTVIINDTNNPALSITSLGTTMYERITNDYVRVTLSRSLGNTNVISTLTPGNFTYGGTAVIDVDYFVNTNSFVSFATGDRSVGFNIASPINDNILKGNRTLIIGLTGTVDYTATTNTGTATIVEDEDPAETILWSDNFNLADYATNYVTTRASQDANGDNYTADYAFDYNAAYGILPAPHSSSDALGLHLNLNKDSISGASGMNYYPTNQNFGTNFAFRFDMYLFDGTLATTEHAIFGVNHTNSGTYSATNWIRDSTYGNTNQTLYDGLWAAVQSDGTGGTRLGDYNLFTGPRTTNAGYVQPTRRASAAATSFAQVFKNPPYSAFNGTIGVSGIPANLSSPVFPQEPAWAEVELSQVIQFGKPVITLRINHSVIFQYTNTLASSVAATNGTVMLGYLDAYDSATGNSQGVIYDNARVVSLDPLRIVTQPLSGNVPSGGSTNLVVTAAGTITGVTNYQWRLYGTNLPGATSATLSLSSIQLTNYGPYTVVVSDGVFSQTSSTATLNPPAPTVNAPTPTTQAVPFGLSASINAIGITSSGLTNYQWLMGSPLTNVSGANYAGITTPTLGIASMRTTNAGPYRLRVNDGFNSVTSTVATVTVAIQPTISNYLSGGGSVFNVSFPTELGPKYVVEWKGELTNGAWNPLSTNSGTGILVTVPDGPLSGLQRFYRVRMQ